MVRSAKSTSSYQSCRFFFGLFAWLIICAALVSSGLGVIAFFGSTLLVLCVWGLSDKWPSDTSASAYSVFNRNGQAIPGDGLTMKQLDRQLRGGSFVGAAQDSFCNEPSIFATKDTTTSASSSTGSRMTPEERARRRKNAAAAAERRVAQSNSDGAPDAASSILNG